MSYVDGFVFAVPKKNRGAYIKMAKEGKRMFTKLGAIDYKECRLTDATPKYAELTFPKLMKAKPSEEIWFSYVVYKSKKHRDAANKQMMRDMGEWEKKGKKMEMPFKMNRMAVGGFEAIVE
ncbi:MAG: DUF1428 domain-containing protein [Patescibacteria group bacterium]